MRSNVPVTVALVPLTVAEPATPPTASRTTPTRRRGVIAVSPLEVDAIALWLVPVL